MALFDQSVIQSSVLTHKELKHEELIYKKETEKHIPEEVGIVGKVLIHRYFKRYILEVQQTLLSKATYNKHIPQKNEKRQYVSVAAVRMFKCQALTITRLNNFPSQ